MENLTCDICDGRLVVDKGGAVICSKCGSVYTVAAMREKYQRLQGTDADEQEKPKEEISVVTGDQESILSKVKVYKELGDIDSAENVCVQYLVDHPDANPVREEIENIKAYKLSVKTEGTILKGKVVSIKEFGVFVEFYKGCEGMVHISQLSNKRLNSCNEVCKIGDEVWVKCRGLDKMGRISYSAKECSDKNRF